MQLALHALAAILATWRLTELVTEDRVTEPFRRRLGWYVLGCPRCASVWAGLVCTVAFVWFPWANWPLALAWTWIVRKAHDQRYQVNKWAAIP